MPDVQDNDICGSCFSIKEYNVAPEIGGNKALRNLRQKLSKKGINLMLDFVPNHTALDHPWVVKNSKFFVEIYGDKKVLANGRDPNFPCWEDTLQLNYSNECMQDSMKKQLSKIASLCDGVRCDMAMLILPDIFKNTWGKCAEPFWNDAIEQVRKKHPKFLFLAEVYWGREYELQQAGFDFVYDKEFYDRLRSFKDCYSKDPRLVYSHLKADLDFQSKLVRFLENHDESRAAKTFSQEIHMAAAILIYLAPGAKLFHQGQLNGLKKKLPIQLCRRPYEEEDQRLKDFYENLLKCVNHQCIRMGNWQLLECRSENDSCDGAISFLWQIPGAQKLFTIVNYWPFNRSIHVQVPLEELSTRNFQLGDIMGSDRIWNKIYYINFNIYYNKLMLNLHIELDAWGYHILELY